MNSVYNKTNVTLTTRLVPKWMCSRHRFSVYEIRRFEIYVFQKRVLCSNGLQGGRSNIEMSSQRYRDSHYKYRTVLRPSYLSNVNPNPCRQGLWKVEPIFIRGQWEVSVIFLKTRYVNSNPGIFGHWRNRIQISNIDHIHTLLLAQGTSVTSQSNTCTARSTVI